jgi:hypothetical protein
MRKTKKAGPQVKFRAPSAEFRITASPDAAKGVYSNIALIQHTRNEFIIDFLLRLTGEAQLVSRVILSPQHVAALLKALALNKKKFEDMFGKIRTEKTKTGNG